MDTISQINPSAMLRINAEQIRSIKEAIGKVDFSKDAKEKIGAILENAKKAGALDEAGKEGLLNLIKTDMTKDLIEAEACKIVLEEIDDLLKDLKQ